VSSNCLPRIESTFSSRNSYNAGGEFREEAIAYLYAEEDEHDEYIFSFIAICKHLGLDPVKTRHAIFNATHRIRTRRRAA
jgi:Rieske Fe-S protein